MQKGKRNRESRRGKRAALLSAVIICMAAAAGTAGGKTTGNVVCAAEDSRLAVQDMTDKVSDNLKKSITEMTETEERTGSVTVCIEAEREENIVNGIRFFCKKIGEVKNGAYELEPEYQETNVNLNQIKNASDLREAAENLRACERQDAGNTTAQRSSRIQSNATDINGEARFSELETGVYLIYAENNPAYDVIEPSLIAIPTWSEAEGRMLYDVEISPKHGPRPKEDVPKTGVEEAILPYIAAAAGSLFLVTACVAGRRKKKKS